MMEEELSTSLVRVLAELEEPDEVYYDTFHRGRECVSRQHCEPVEDAG